MIENTTIARPYARAVFEHAREEGNIAEWSSLLKLLAVIASDPQMKRMLSNPGISRDQLLDLITGLCGDSLPANGLNFIKLLVNAGRFIQLAGISALFEEKWAEDEGRMEINVHTAYALVPDQEAGISEAMAGRLGKKITVSSVVDESLIGGMIIRAGDSVIDVSLRGSLNELRRSLLR